jgi:hypothetical protein
VHFTRRLDHGFDGLDAECTDKLVLQIRRALVEAQTQQSVRLKGDAQPRRRQPVPELGLLRGVIQARKRDTEPVRPVSRRERTRVRDSAHRYDLYALGSEVPTMALRKSVQRHPVAVALD